MTTHSVKMWSRIIPPSILRQSDLAFRMSLRQEHKTQQHRKLSSKEAIARDKKYCAHNYESIPVVLSKGEGVYMWDVEGKKYFDFLSGYGATNLGHCHPKILSTVREQVGILHHTSRAFYSEALGEFAEYVTELLNFDKVLPMNTGAEGFETAVKLGRKWGYYKKNIPRDQAICVFACENFHGRTLAALSASTDPSSYQGYGPYVPNFDWVKFNNLEDLERKLCNPNVCCFIVEPIQGEAGIVVPDDGYLKGVRDICTKHNVLFIADEVQTGIGRTGKMLAVEHECVKPDALVLGKALTGGFYPVSAVLADDDVMLVIEPGTHGSTFGGNPLGCKIAVRTLQVMSEENVIENSKVMGEMFREQLSCAPKEIVETVRGKGLFNSVVLKSHISGWDVCMMLKDRGLLSKATHGHIIRFTPPLIINEKEMEESTKIILSTLEQVAEKVEKK
ncbi:ornithine aminotransferase, mitochondrial isoform X2 [Anabrus simplex]|uniref:ornithine aminotransferase, mitochondrial isoform X2 n=1 Tax=Anabrus simplex TaxID=316456 RepID=UPI0035A37401